MSRDLTLEIPDSIFQKISRVAKTKKCKVEEFVTAVINEFVEDNLTHINNPFFKQKAYKGKGLRDVSRCHDKYLYGMDE